MACNCYNANNSHKEIKTYTQLLTTLPFRVFLMCGFIPCTHFTTRDLVCPNHWFSRAIWIFRMCMPRWTVYTQLIILTELKH